MDVAICGVSAKGPCRMELAKKTILLGHAICSPDPSAR